MNSPVFKTTSGFLHYSPSQHTNTEPRSVFLRDIGKDRQAPEHNWTCSYTTTGSWQCLGKRLGSPREAWNLTRPNCARHSNRHTAPPLPWTIAPFSAIQRLQTTPLCSVFTPFWHIFFQISLLLQTLCVLSSYFYPESGVIRWTQKHTYSIKLCEDAFPKFPKKFPLAFFQIPVSEVCVSKCENHVPSCLISSAVKPPLSPPRDTLWCYKMSASKRLTKAYYPAI